MRGTDLGNGRSDQCFAAKWTCPSSAPARPATSQLQIDGPSTVQVQITARPRALKCLKAPAGRDEVPNATGWRCAEVCFGGVEMDALRWTKVCRYCSLCVLILPPLFPLSKRLTTQSLGPRFKHQKKCVASPCDCIGLMGCPRSASNLEECLTSPNLCQYHSKPLCFRSERDSTSNKSAVTQIEMSPSSRRVMRFVGESRPSQGLHESSAWRGSSGLQAKDERRQRERRMRWDVEQLQWVCLGHLGDGHFGAPLRILSSVSK